MRSGIDACIMLATTRCHQTEISAGVSSEPCAVAVGARRLWETTGPGLGNTPGNVLKESESAALHAVSSARFRGWLDVLPSFSEG